MNSKKLHSFHKSITMLLLLITCTTMLFTLIPLCYPFLVGYPIYLFKHFSSSYDHYYYKISAPTTATAINIDDDPTLFLPVEASSSSSSSSSCDIFTGEWVPNPEAPYYTNTTCWAIHDHQNCMKYGRPDTDFMKWKWKPDGCELPVLDPAQFLETVRGKSMAFVGDSVSRNQMQSLMCLLSRVEYPIDVSYTPDEQFKRWNYTSYNFLMATFWAPYLVKAQEADPNLGPNQTPGLFSLYLDEVNQDWTSQIQDFDYVIISAGHWFFRPLIYYEKRKIVGCRFCQLQNVTDYPMSFGYKMAFRTAFRAINSMRNFKGITFLRTFAPSHFENGEWNEGGDCPRQGPLRSNATSLEGWNFELYMTQVEEFRAAERVGRENGLRFRLLDTTQATLMRADGHPSRYGHAPNANVSLYNDCVHWCLPGPIDTWNDFLLEMLKIEDVSSYVEEKKLHMSDRKLRFFK